MAASIWTSASASSQPALSLQFAARTAQDLRAGLMSRALAFSAQPQVWAKRSATELVDVRAHAPRLAVLAPPPWSARGLRLLVSPGLARRLDRASRDLPEGLSLGIWEGFRPIWVQRAIWKAGFDLLREAHPDMERELLEEVLEACVARPDEDAPHHSGRAVDVALVDATGQVLDPTLGHNLFASDALRSALDGAGLSNYAPEWWHWSDES